MVYIYGICRFCTYAEDLHTKLHATQSQKPTEPLHSKEIDNKPFY